MNDSETIGPKARCWEVDPDPARLEMRGEIMRLTAKVATLEARLADGCKLLTQYFGGDGADSLLVLVARAGEQHGKLCGDAANIEGERVRLEVHLAEVAADPRLRLPYLIEAHEQDEWEPAEAHHDESDAEARRSGYECSTRVRALRSARAEREKGGAA